MLEFDDIQHILLTRAPALTGRYEFLSFRNAGGRTRVAGGHPGKGAVGRGDASFGRQGQSLGDGGLHLERPARARRGRGFAGHVSRRVQAGNGRPRGDARRHRRESSRSLGRRSGQPGPARDRHPVRPRRRRTRALRSGARKARRAAARAWKCCRRWTWRRRRRSTMRTITSAIATGSRSRSSKGRGEEPTPGSGPPLKAGEFILGYPDENGPPSELPQPEILSRNGSFMAYRRLEEHVGDVSRLPARARQDARGTGTGRGETDGPLAQRRAACAGAGQRRSRAGRRSAAQQRLQLQAMDPLGMRCRSARTSGG